MTEKAIILAAGAGTRMAAPDHGILLEDGQADAADRGIKGMIPFGGRPFIDHAVSALADAGITQVCVVVSPGAREMRTHFERAKLTRVRIEIAEQTVPRGAADALIAAEAFAAGDHALVVNADNYYPVHVLEALRTLPGAGIAAFDRASLIARGNIDAARIASYALVIRNADGTLQRIVEKPTEIERKQFGDALVSMNSWMMPPEIYAACRSIEPSSRGEVELQSAVQYSIDALGARFSVLPFEDGVLDLTYRADISAVAQRLRRIEPVL